ncbi:Tfp pilus assembly protein PilX [Candidatus Vecturithrix granuli]|uniref:Tfp pilus assembly protein PilX n=1 Tax=Vecturithrix granuli TaxID=1499967 RepID=A0A081BYL4_VECG1|nr:Tfp pilus assembly protein PilX [Candidatus Vecturithrix granuli]
MKHIFRQRSEQQAGVALVAALFVLVVLSTLVIAVLADVQGELRMSAVERNSERALKLAELGVQIARGTILQGELGGELSSVDGFAQGGYFFTTLGSGFPGNEKWEQWHFDASITGNNNLSEITTPVRPIWAKELLGVNGTWADSDTNFTLHNLYGIVAGGAYFQLEEGTGTAIRAVDEYRGSAGVDFDPKGNFSPKTVTWKGNAEGDKTIKETDTSQDAYNRGYAVRMSPMASYTNISTIPGQENPMIVRQTLYLTYAGGSTSTTVDTDSTVRLRAVNSLCNSSDTGNPPKTQNIWEFDTGLHGIGTAPAFFDPSPDQPGDELIYFAVVHTGNADLKLRSSIQNFPIHSDNSMLSENIYIYALVDESKPTDATDPCSRTGSYRLKWTRPFPDPDVNDWTDYAIEQTTGTNGQRPPYVRRPSDMTPFLPEDDLLADYRHDRYNTERTSIAASVIQGQMRGNVYTGFFEPPSISPVILKGLYELDTVNTDGTRKISDQREDAVADGDPADPMLELYLAYTVHPMFKRYGEYYYGAIPYDSADGADAVDAKWDKAAGRKKLIQAYVQVIALRDRLDGSCDTNGKNCSWNWSSAKSRFPTFKWMYKVPAWDPSRSDKRPWNGYGEFTWDTWFDQQIAPMIGLIDEDQDGTAWGSVSGSGRDQYVVIYPSYESLGFVDEAGDNVKNGPTTGNGSPVDFSNDNWADSRLMVAAVRDTWDDYMEGRQTNPLYSAMKTQNNPFAMPVQSSPMEPYWTHKHDGTICASDGSMPADKYPIPFETETVITYSSTEAAAWNNADKIGFPRPYTWWEALWNANVKNNTLGLTGRGMTDQGWANTSGSSSNSSDIDVEGETSAFCRECANNDGIIVQVFNHDLGTTIEDLRVHGINAKTGKHVWDYHMPTVYLGDNSNSTPAIANGLVFIGFDVNLGNLKGAYLQVLNADNGESRQRMVVDRNADALIMSPTIANGAVYLATYDWTAAGTRSESNPHYIRLYAYSPVLRLFSIGVYPIAYTNESTIPDFSTYKPDVYMPRAERKIQVWITGSGSKWEEIRETVSVAPTPTPNP